MERANKNKPQSNPRKEILLVIGTNAKPITEILNLVVHKALANLGYVSFPPMSVTIHYSTMEQVHSIKESLTDSPYRIFSTKHDPPLYNDQLTQNKRSCTASLQNQEARHHHQQHEVLLEWLKEDAQ